MNRSGLVGEKSMDFAVEIILLSKKMQREGKEYDLSRQLLRSGTSIGANIRESSNAESRKDFVHKLSIALKECSETIYWLELLQRTNYLTRNEFKEKVGKAYTIERILTIIIKSTKAS